MPPIGAGRYLFWKPWIEIPKRSVYIPVIRNIESVVLGVFECPKPHAVVGQQFKFAPHGESRIWISELSRHRANHAAMG